MNKKMIFASFVIVAIMIASIFALSVGGNDNPATPTDISVDPGSITITKQLVGDIWHIRCDYMDGVTFKAGGGIWKRDPITNPDGILSQEGHRSNKCGDADHWVIWVGTDGVPYRMDEIKSGATGGTLPTVIYRPRYHLSDDEIHSAIEGDEDLRWRYSQNFIDVMSWSDIRVGERMYWTTANNNQVWYHTGIPYTSCPTFILFVDGNPYPLVAGESVEISDLLPGIHEITENADATYYLGDVTSTGSITSTGEWIVSINLDDGQNVSVNWPNVVITPRPQPSPRVPDPPVIETSTPEPTDTPAPTESQTPVTTEVITDGPTSCPTDTAIPTPTVTPTSRPTPIPSPTETRETERPTPTRSPDPTLTETPTTTPVITPEPTPPDETHKWIYSPKTDAAPINGRIPKRVGDWITFEEYDTPLGIDVIINHVGDCFD